MEELFKDVYGQGLQQVDLSTVYLRAYTEFIPHYKIGRCVRFVEKDVQDWLQKRKSSGRSAMKYDIKSLV